MVSDSISGEIGITSCSAIRPRYPVLAQLRQPDRAVEHLRHLQVLERPPRADQLLLGRRVRLLAPVAQPAGEPLGQHAVQRRADQERLDAHLGEPGDRAGRVVGVQRGEHR